MEDEKVIELVNSLISALDAVVIELVNSLISALDAVTKALDIPPTENGTVFSEPEVIGNAIIAAGETMAEVIGNAIITAGETIAEDLKTVAKEIEIK